MRKIRAFRKASISVLALLAIVWCHVAAARRTPFAAAVAGTKAGTIEVDGRTRRYLMHLPPPYDGRNPPALVFVLHGATESPESVEHLSGMSAQADKANFMAVYPSGTGRENPARLPTWNSGNCCDYAMQNKVDDVAFLRELVRKTQTRLRYRPEARLCHGHIEWRDDVL